MMDTLEDELDFRYPLDETEPGDQRSAFLQGWVAGVNFTRAAFDRAKKKKRKRDDWLWAILLGGVIVMAIFSTVMALRAVL